MNRRATRRSATPAAFSLMELLVCVAIIAVLVSLLLPSLARARAQGRAVTCAAQLRQIGLAWHAYAAESRGRVMPAAYSDAALIGGGPVRYWWGTNDLAGVDHARGFLWPQMPADLRQGGIYECPAQPWGTYAPQGAAATVTSTFGYNGYYLSPPHTPGWSGQIGHRPWQMLDAVGRSSEVFAFADALLDFGGPRPHNAALLDPPWLFGGGAWSRNFSPTTAFRHRGRANALAVDGHAAARARGDGRITAPQHQIGSVGAENGPHYVPDWRAW